MVSQSSRTGVSTSTKKNRLGKMYEEGQGIPKNRKVAKEWYKKACTNGDQQSCDAYRTLD